MKHPRQIDGLRWWMHMARRGWLICRIYPIPVLWRKLPGARFCGRVAIGGAGGSSATANSSIEKFVAREYWSMWRP